MHYPLASALLGLLLCSAPAIAQDPGVATETDFLAWAAETAIPVDLSRGIDTEVLAPLVAGKRFVYLGEPDHYIQEKYTFRLAGLRTLHALGWRHLGMEMGHSDGLRYDRFLESGDENELTDIGIYGSVRSVETAVAASGFLGSEMTYARRVREIASGPERLHYFGFDVDTSPGNGIVDARARLKGVPEAEELGLILEDAWNAQERVEELAALLSELQENPDSELTAALSSEVREDLLLDLHALCASLRFEPTVRELGQSNPAGMLEAFAERERAMYPIFDAYVARLAPEERVVLTGHNMHLGRGWEGALWAEQDQSFRVPLWPTIGAYVAERFPGQVLSIWLVYDHGMRLTSGGGGEPRDVVSIDGTVESLLARLPHDALLLPLASDDPRSAWLDDERNFRVNGGIAWGRLRELTDVLLFVREGHAPHTTE